MSSAARSDLHAERRCHGLDFKHQLRKKGHQSCDTPIKGIHHDQSYKTLIHFYDLNGKQTGHFFLHLNTSLRFMTFLFPRVFLDPIFCVSQVMTLRPDPEFLQYMRAVAATGAFRERLQHYAEDSSWVPRCSTRVEISGWDGMLVCTLR